MKFPALYDGKFTYHICLKLGGRYKNLRMVKSQFLYLWCIKRDIELAFLLIGRCFNNALQELQQGMWMIRCQA